MQKSGQLPEPLLALVTRETAGEPIQWIARPSPRAAFLTSMSAWLMGIPWSAFSCTMFGILFAAVFFSKQPTRSIAFVEYAAASAGLLFAGLFVAIGFAMLAAPFWAAYKARRTAYIITNKRLLIVTAGSPASIASIHPGQMHSFERKEHRDGSGTLSIVTGLGKNSDGEVQEQIKRLFAIADVGKVEQNLQKLRARYLRQQ